MSVSDQVVGLSCRRIIVGTHIAACHIAAFQQRQLGLLSIQRISNVDVTSNSSWEVYVPVFNHPQILALPVYCYAR
jgi:hypothetical protein